MKYQVQHYYAAISPPLGPWEALAVVDLDETTAAWVNRDCPGTLAPPSPDEPVMVSQRAPDMPPQDRQLKRGQKRRLDRQGDPSDGGPITKAEYKAVIDKKK